MKIYVAFGIPGIYVLNEEGKVVAKEGFFKEDLLDYVLGCMSNEVSEKEQIVVDEIKNKCPECEIVFEVEKKGYRHEFPNPAGEYIRKNMDKLILKQGFVKNKEEINAFLKEFNVRFTKHFIKEKVGKDRIIIQVINAIDELDKIINTMNMRLKEWYLWYFPELFEVYKSNEAITKYVAEKTYRSDIKGIDLETSAGIELDKEDLKELRNYALKILELMDEKKELEDYLDKIVKENMPNMYEIVGSLLTARLIEYSGSLERLASFPSSTIQILGAEKALFMFLKGKGKSPKHGIIFMSSYIQQVPKKFRGKMARVLAQKISIASKLDYYKGEFKGKEYRKELDKLLNELKNK